MNRQLIAATLYRMNGRQWYGRDLGDWDNPESRIGRNEFERARWFGQADHLLAAASESDVFQR